MSTRRKFLAGSAGAIAGALASVGSGAAETTVRPSTGEIADLCGEWLFRADLANLGTKNNWFGEKGSRQGLATNHRASHMAGGGPSGRLSGSCLVLAVI